MASYYFKVMENDRMPISTLLGLQMGQECIPPQIPHYDDHTPEGFNRVSLSLIENPNNQGQEALFLYEGEPNNTEIAIGQLKKSVLLACAGCALQKNGTCIGAGFSRKDGFGINPETGNPHRVVIIKIKPILPRNN